jgi:hypothetical protein
MLRFTALLLLAAGCAPAPSIDTADDLSEVEMRSLSILDGTPAAVGVLAVLNDPNTTLSVLDDDVPLNRRAAQNLTYRKAQGPFNTMADVDDVYWVGESTMNALLAYATAQGRVPQGDETLGTWDGVEFSVTQAETMLEIVVNDLDHHDFDVYLGLDRRAADSIVAAQPVATVAHLAGLYYVGNSALQTLKDEAAEMMDDEWSDVSCIPEFAAWESPAGDDLDELLAAATTMDWAFAEVISLQATGCDGAWWDTTTGDEILWNVSFFIDLSELPGDSAEISPWQADGGYEDMLDTALTVIDERVLDGDWSPSSSNRNQRLYDNRFDMVDDLTSDAAANPGSFLRKSLYMDMSECSESAELLLDTRNGVISIVHQFPGC